MSLSYEQLLERNRKLLEEQKKKAIADSDKIYDAQVADVNASYKRAIDNAKTEYESEHERNTVSRRIAEKKIAEHNANLGLTDSGLSRMQLTAAEVSANNRAGKIELARRQTVDGMEAKLAEAVSAILINKEAARGSIGQNYDALAANNAAKEYEANANAQAQMYKAAVSGSRRYSGSVPNKDTVPEKTGLITVDGGLVSRDYLGKLADNGVGVFYDAASGTATYVDNNTGKKTTMDMHVNPYRGGQPHKDIRYGFFENTPYQPDNISGDKLKKSGDTFTYYGNTQNVWTVNGKYYIWDTTINDYREVIKQNGNWVVK